LLADTAGERKTGPRQPPLVITADDDLSITTLIRALLSSDGIRCETTDNGARALELARELRPDVLVLDVNMPTLGGFEVLTQLKRDPITARMRVILLTGAEQESDIMRGFTLGASDYIVKPFNPMELLVRIRRFIRS
jgi:DNA-binding response OmpR family regulator